MVYITVERPSDALISFSNVPAVTSVVPGLNGNYYLYVISLPTSALYDGTRNTIISFNSNQDFELFISSTLAIPTTYTITLLNDTGDVLFSGQPAFGASSSFMGNILKGKVYLLSFATTVTGGASVVNPLILFAKQTRTVKYYIPNGFTQSTLPNCVTTYDTFFRPTFTFSNFSMIAGNNYNLTFGYEPTKSGSFTVTSSNPTITSSPETVNFSSGVSCVYAFQALQTGTFSFVMSFSVNDVGSSLITDLTSLPFSGISPPLSVSNCVLLSKRSNILNTSNIVDDKDDEADDIEVIDTFRRRKL